MNGRIKTLIINLCVTVCSFVLIGGICEITARFFYASERSGVSCYVKDPVLGHRPKANCEYAEKEPEGDHRITYRFNNCGFRDENPCGKRPASVFRIVGIGDSFTFGAMLDYEDTYLAIAEQHLQKHSYPVEILKTGVSGWELYEYTAWFEKALSLDPQLVLIGLLPNDLFEANSKEAWQRKSRLYQMGLQEKSTREIEKTFHPWHERFVGYMTQNSAFLNWFKHCLFSCDAIYIRSYLISRNQQQGSYLSKEYGPEWTERMVNLRRVLSGMATRARRENVQLAVVIIPQRIQAVLLDKQGGLPADVAVFKFSDTISRMCHELDIPVFDFLKAISHTPKGGTLYYPVDGHLNKQGARFLGEFVAQELVNHKLVPSRKGRDASGLNH
jgi:hypothetical protein